MSSHKNPQNNAYVGETWSHNFNGEEHLHRPPKQVTESRVLSRLLNKNQISEPQPHQHSDSSNIAMSGNKSSQATFSQRSQQPLTLPEVRSVLSADAKEFVPRSKAAFVSNTYPDEEHSQDDAFSLSVTAAEFVPRVSENCNFTTVHCPKNCEDYEQYPNYILEGVNNITMHGHFDRSSTYGGPSNHILDRFNHALHVLNMHPGNMEEYLRPICEMINRTSDTLEIVNDMVESLFNQSLREKNFRYTGARICQFLNTKFKNSPHFSGFIKIFVKRCEEEYARRDELKNGSRADQERLIGLAMLIAEIFLNVETESPDGTIQRLQSLPNMLVDFVKTFLTSPSDLDVKCLCQLLKLSGGMIEDVAKNSAEECIKFEEIFTQLQSLQSSPKLTENTKFMIGSVIELKECDWNRNSSSPTKKSVCLFPPEPNNFQIPEPVFYNQMGAPCSRTEAGFIEEDSDVDYVLNEEEENAFLIWQAEQERLTGDQDGSVINDTGYDSFQFEGVVDEGGMGEEMEAAFEEFLQKQSFLQSYQPQIPCLPEQQQPPVHQIFNLPPSIIPPHQEFNGYQHQHMLPPNQQGDQIPQQQDQQQFQTQFTNSDPYYR